VRVAGAADLAELIRTQVLDDSPRPPAQPAQLTAREPEVAEPVAEGLSNQAVATRLCLSRRTVETQLSAIYRKADAPSRAALASLRTGTAFGGLS
jgi:DNA-binding NarL/FixJ family response regulator